MGFENVEIEKKKQENAFPLTKTRSQRTKE